ALERDPAGDQIRVEVERARLLDEGFQIGPEQRLAAGEVDLHDSELLGLAQHASPIAGVEPVVAPGEIDRVGAIRAVQRAGVGQLRDQRVRARGRAHPGTCKSPRLAISSRNSSTSWRSSGAGRLAKSFCTSA